MKKIAKQAQIDFSVVVACYNPDLEKLKKTIISIENQLGEVKFEIIISDDGSQKDYKDEIKNWADNMFFDNIIYNFLPNNVGTVKNFLSATKIANGKYIKPISPGDYLFDANALCKYKKAFEENDASLVFGKMAYYDSHKKRILHKSAPINKDLFKGKNLLFGIIDMGDFISGASIAMLKETMQKYLEEIAPYSVLLEDVPLTYLSVLNDDKVFGIEDFVVWYEFGTGVSTQKESKLKGQINEDFNQVLDYLYTKYPEKMKNWKRIRQGHKKIFDFPRKIYKIKQFFAIFTKINAKFCQMQQFLDYKPKYKLVDFVKHGDERGMLIAVENQKDVPFDIKRVYYIFDTLKDVRRGFHAHKNLQQVLICVSGKCKIHIDDGNKTFEVPLEDSSRGLYLSNDVWREMYDFSPDAVLVVLASEIYNEKDYIRNYDDFIKYIKEKK